MSSLVRMSNGKMRLYMKGAAEMMLELCDRQLTKDNEVVVC
jgi:magnesium-transporting ATPase (P-type)